MYGSRHILMLALVVTAASAAATETGYAVIPGGSFRSVLPVMENRNTVVVSQFEFAVRLVTNREYREFVLRHPQWQRGTASTLFVGREYLAAWQSPLMPGAAVLPDAPVTQVSWFAAQAYCEAQSARLPTWYEWEYVAAADAIRRDARDDPAWRQRILAWYSEPNPEQWPAVGQGEPNAYGVWDMHGLVWEWVLDYNAMLVSADSREQSGADKLQFCGAGALGVEDKDNYAILMRIAYLSALQADYTTANLGFRCVRDLQEQTP